MASPHFFPQCMKSRMFPGQHDLAALTPFSNLVRKNFAFQTSPDDNTVVASTPSFVPTYELSLFDGILGNGQCYGHVSKSVRSPESGLRDSGRSVETPTSLRGVFTPPAPAFSAYDPHTASIPVGINSWILLQLMQTPDQSVVVVSQQVLQVGLSQHGGGGVVQEVRQVGAG